MKRCIVRALASLSILAAASLQAAAPVFTSPPTASPNPAYIGQLVSFTAAASGSSALVYTWDFGDGTSGAGANVTHRYTFVAQTFTVKCTATDGASSTVASTQITTKNALFGYGLDSDGDGFSDIFETLVGTDPNDINSTPLNGVPASSDVIGGPLTKLNLSIKLSKDKATMTIKGSLIGATLPKSAVAGQKTYIEIETLQYDPALGLARANLGMAFTLNAKGTLGTADAGKAKYRGKNQPRGKARKADPTPEVDEDTAFDRAEDLKDFMRNYGKRTAPVDLKITATYNGKTYTTSATGTLNFDADGNAVGLSVKPP